jgi:hypothetical protein
VAAALVARLVAKFSEAPVQAGADGDVVLGAVNNKAMPTSIINTATGFSFAVGGNANAGDGKMARSNSYGVVVTLRRGSACVRDKHSRRRDDDTGATRDAGGKWNHPEWVARTR